MKVPSSFSLPSPSSSIPPHPTLKAAPRWHGPLGSSWGVARVKIKSKPSYEVMNTGFNVIGGLGQGEAAANTPMSDSSKITLTLPSHHAYRGQHYTDVWIIWTIFSWVI